MEFSKEGIPAWFGITLFWVAVGRALLARSARRELRHGILSGQELNHLIFIIFPFQGFQGVKPAGRIVCR